MQETKLLWFFLEAIHLVGILGGKSAFSVEFCFFRGILTFPPEFHFPRENAKYLGILSFPSGFSLFPLYFGGKTERILEEKVKILREKSKFRGILHFPLEKVKNLHFSLRKVKILRKK